MSKQLIKNYSYNVSAKTVTFTDFTTILLKNVLVITDVTTGAILYQFNTSGVGASVSTNVLTLASVPSGTANTDSLQIYYDVQTGDPRYDGGQTTMANSQPVVLPNDQSAIPVMGNTASGSTDSGNPVKVGGIYNSAPSALTTGQRSNLNTDSFGNLKVTVLSPNSTTALGYAPTNTDAVGVDASAVASKVFDYGLIFNGTTWDRIRSAVGAVAAGTGTLGVTPVPGATALALTSFQNTAVTTTVVSVKASAGRLHRIVVQNPNTSLAWLQIFNTASGSVTLGTTVPLMSIPIPASSIFEDFYQFSDTFSTAISIAATTTPTGATALTTGLFVSLGYI